MSGQAEKVEFREARPADAVAILTLWTEAYVNEGGGGRTLPYKEADVAETAARGRVFVAERSGATVGVVALLAPGAPGSAVAQSGEAELCRLAVAAPARRQGIGRALTRHCTNLARAEGWDAIALWSRAYQTAAHRLYESLGYRQMPERNTTDETGHKRIVFRLDLDTLPE